MRLHSILAAAAFWAALPAIADAPVGAGEPGPDSPQIAREQREHQRLAQEARANARDAWFRASREPFGLQPLTRPHAFPGLAPRQQFEARALMYEREAEEHEAMAASQGARKP